MIKILFVCHGNICRSPMAEFIMKDIVNKNKASDLFEISSCGTSYEEMGNPIYPPARKKLSENMISCEEKRACRMERQDYDYYDYIVAMDSMNIKNILRITEGDPENKISLLMEFAGRYESVKDPWYTGDFESTFRDIKEGCMALFKKLYRGYRNV